MDTYSVVMFLNGYPEDVVFEGTLGECLAKADELNEMAEDGVEYFVD